VGCGERAKVDEAKVKVEAFGPGVADGCGLSRGWKSVCLGACRCMGETGPGVAVEEEAGYVVRIGGA
jgi:hypothetical protein